MTQTQIRFLHFAPAFLYMGLIYYLSSRPAPAALHDWPTFLDLKLVHLIEYALLAFLWIHGFRKATNLRLGTVCVWTVALVFAWGVSDEFHQSFNPARTASWKDALADLIAALVSVAAYAVWPTAGHGRRAPKPGHSESTIHPPPSTSSPR